MRAPIPTLLLAATLAAPTAAGDCGVTRGWHCDRRWEPAETNDAGWAGTDVALDGRFAAVGEPGADRVHLYRRSGGLWRPAGRLDDPNGGGHDFGGALDIDGTRLVVGARHDDLFGPLTGAVHVYELHEDGATLVETLRDQTPWGPSNFGLSVALHGRWLAVGAPFDGTGRVHVFWHDGAAWQLADEIGAGAEVSLGYSVAVHDVREELRAVVFAGDPSNDGTGMLSGVVQHYQVTPTQTLVGPPIQPIATSGGDELGRDLAFDGRWLVVGAHQDDTAGFLAGAAYVYDVASYADPMGASLVDVLTPCGPAGELDESHFGLGIDVADGRIAVGARGQAASDAPGGALYVYARSGAGFALEERVVPRDGFAVDYFATDVVLDGDSALVGAPGVDGDGVFSLTGTGAAYLVELDAP